MGSIGIEWVNEYHGRASDLSNNDNNAQGFYNKLDGTERFEYGDDNAWDQDFEASGVGSPTTGTDTSYSDNVDIMFFSGHGSTSGMFFGKSANDDGTARPSDMRLGNKDLEWLVIDACKLLNSSDVFSRLEDSFVGLHYMLGFHTTCSDVKTRGEKFAKKLNDGWHVRCGWIDACTETESSSCECAYLRAYSSGADTLNDHWHGKGSVSDDPAPTSFVYLRTSC
jgi:uncharacterized protein DUF6345